LATGDADSLIKLAEVIESKLDNLAKTGFFFDLGSKVVKYLETGDLGNAWSFLKSYADYNAKLTALEIFRSVVDWVRRTQSYCAQKWGSASPQYQRFMRGNQKMLKLFERSSIQAGQIAVPFAQQASEFRMLIEQKPASKWKRIIVFLPDLVRLLVIVLRG